MSECVSNIFDSEMSCIANHNVFKARLDKDRYHGVVQLNQNSLPNNECQIVKFNIIGLKPNKFLIRKFGALFQGKTQLDKCIYVNVGAKLQT